MYHPHTDPEGNGRPQAVALAFLALVFFMLLLPLAEISVEGNGSPAPLLFLVETRQGFNPLALLLLILPIVGIFVVLFAGAAWRLGGAIVGLVGVVLIPLTLAITGREMHGPLAGSLTSVSPGVGAFVIVAGYAIITIVELIAAIGHRRMPR